MVSAAEIYACEQCLRGRAPKSKFACFVCDFKILHISLKYDVCILKQIAWEIQNGISVAVFKVLIENSNCQICYNCIFSFLKTGC